MIKNISFIFLSFFIFFSSVNCSECTIDDAVNASIPDRTNPWKLNTNQAITFNEYYISGKNLACGFKAFGYDSREEAIDAMLNALNDNDTKYERRNRKMREYIKNDYAENISVEEYLNKIKNIKHELSYNANKYFLDQNKKIQKIDPNLPILYTLIDAFAVLNNKNLYIYSAAPGEKILFISHAFSNDSSNVNQNLSLLHKNQHYNRLVETGHVNTNIRSQNDEDKHLTELRNSLLEEGRFREEQLSLNISFDSFSSEPLEEEIFFSLESPKSPEEEITFEDFSSSFLPTTPCYDLEFTEDEPHNQVSQPAQTEISFTASQIKYFVFGKAKYLPGLNAYESLIAAYKNAAKLFDDQNALFCHIQIYLKKNFLHENNSIDSMLKKLDTLINKKGSQSVIKKYRHYAKIYKGQIYVKQKELNKAWEIFDNLKTKNECYTKTYFLDMSEMILLYEYTPNGMTRENAVALAWTLFNKTIGNGKTQKKQTSNSTRQNDTFHPDYYKSKEANKRRTNIRDKVRRQGNVNRVRPRNRSTQDGSASNVSAPNVSAQPLDQIETMENSIVGRKRTKNSSTIKSQPPRKILRIMTSNTDTNTDTESDTDIDVDTKMQDQVENPENISDLYSLHDDSLNRNHNDDFLDTVDDINEKNKKLRDLILKGKYFSFKKKADEAIKYFSMVLYSNDDENQESIYYEQAYIGLGNVYCYEKQDIDTAIKIYLEGILKCPSSDLYCSLGDAYHYEKKDTNKAIEIYQEGINRCPSADLYRGLGNAYRYEKQEVHTAIEIYQEGIDKYPSAVLYRSLGDTYRYEKHEVHAAIEIYQEGIFKCPSADLYRSLGDAYYYEKKDTNKAIKIYQKGIDKCPSADLYCGLGDAYRYEKKDTNTAIEIYQEGIDRCPSADLYRSLGDSYYYEEKDTNKAISMYQKGIDNYPSADLYRALGDAYRHEKKNTNKAIAIYQEGIEKCPSAELYRALGDAYKYEKKDVYKAISIYQKGIKKCSSSDLYDALGDTYSFNFAKHERDINKSKAYQQKALDAYQMALSFNNHKINDKIKIKIDYIKKWFSSFETRRRIE
ncbi:MAG: tetratricopeptide repeat protein [Alphaproteobacteria bacterium]|nr:tetratricopeptide repeat protein [Alphaproteobacteria bacterium]